MQATQRQPIPKFRDRYVSLNTDGTWTGTVYYFVEMTRRPSGNDQGAAEFASERGEIHEIPMNKLRRMGIAKDRPDPVKAAETRRYRSRSRVTTPQRRAKTRSGAQHTYIIALGRKRGMGIDDLREMTPRKSLSDMTIQEASDLIDRLRGQRRA